MSKEPDIKPMPYTHRKGIFRLLLLLFIIALPFLYLRATGYRFDFNGESTLVKTGGMYIAAERTGAFIYIDDELVREPRVFRSAFYAQNLDPKTHKVSVQKEGHHTWIKELPVYPYLVTEAQAFNLPLAPQIRVVSEWQTATGSAVVRETFVASTTNAFVATTTNATTTFFKNSEYISLLESFSTSTEDSTNTLVDKVTDLLQGIATTSIEVPTTTKEWRGVKLYEDNNDIFAKWIGAREDMPYYYCADEFERYSTSTVGVVDLLGTNALEDTELEASAAELIHPVQTISEDVVCEPVIKIDRKLQDVKSFDFFPGSTDLVVLALDDGVYAVEVDNRAWQNAQPVFMGGSLDMRVVNGQIYVYDEGLIYQIILEN